MKERSEDKRSIDPGDFVGAIIDFINIWLRRRHIFISTTTQNSLYLFIYTFIILISYTKKPLSDFSTYWLAYGLLIYSLLKFVTEVVLTKPDRDFKKIKDGYMAHTQIALVIGKYASKKPKKVIETVEDLTEKGMFKDNIQIALFKKYEEYPTVLAKYIENLLLKFDFSPRALKEYLSKAVNPSLSENYLKKLIEKYRKKDSFLFNLGRYQSYQFDKDSNEKKYYIAGYEFQKKAIWINRYFGLSYSLLIILMYILIAFMVFSLVYLDIKNTIFSLITILAIPLIMFGVDSIHFRVIKKKVREVLKNENIELEDIELERFVSEVTRFHYKTFL